MPTRDIVATTRRTRGASSSPAKNAASSASSNAIRRRSAIEAVIGHMKTDGHLGRCHLKGRAGDAANAILTAVGYNFRIVIAWLRQLFLLILAALLNLHDGQPARKSAS